MAEPNTRKCESCTTEIPAKAMKCPSCNEWREDVKKERNLGYASSAVFLAALYAVSQTTGLPKIVGFTIAIASFVVTMNYYVSVSRKMKNWIWF